MNQLRTEIARLAVGVLGVAAAVSWLSGGCGERIEPAELADARPLWSAADGSLAVVEPVTGPVGEAVSGTLVSAHQTTISSKILARIEAVRVTAGSVVARGDELVILDSRDLEARAREAREGVQAAQAQLDLARRENERVKGMIAGGAASAQQLDQAKSRERVARAELEAAAQRLADAEVGLSYAVIHSPVTGRVVDRLAEPGDTAAPGVPLFQIYDPGALRLEVPVRETLAVRLDAGQTLRVEIAALGEMVEGSIDEIVPFADPGARTLMVKVRLPADPRLFAGMFGRVEVPAGERTRLMIPAAAVSQVGQLQFATVIDAENRKSRRLITTGSERDGRVEVLSGLAAGERVLTPEPS